MRLTSIVPNIRPTGGHVLCLRWVRMSQEEAVKPLARRSVGRLARGLRGYKGLSGSRYAAQNLHTTELSWVSLKVAQILMEIDNMGMLTIEIFERMIKVFSATKQISHGLSIEFVCQFAPGNRTF
jgi:hypothetical protein